MPHTDEFMDGFITALDWVLNTCCEKDMTESGRQQVRGMRTRLLKEKVNKMKEMHDDDN